MPEPLSDKLHEVKLLLDDDDLRAFHEAIARHQSRRVAGEHILPEGNSDLPGAIIGEICRGWLEYVDSF